MKKVFSSLLVLILVLLTGATWYVSIRTKNTFADEVAAINATLPSGVKVDISTYRRGLFTADAETAVTVHGREFIRLHHLLRHFVWGVDIFTTLAPGSVLAVEVKALCPPRRLKMISHVGLQGAFSSEFSLAEVLDKGDVELGEKPYHLTWIGHGDLSTRQLTGHLELSLPLVMAGYRFYDQFRSGRVENRAVLDAQAEQLVGGLIQKGILVREDGYLLVDFSCNSGQCWVHPEPD